MQSKAGRFKKVNTREDKVWVDQVKKERNISKEWLVTYGELINLDGKEDLADKLGKGKNDIHRKCITESSYKSDFAGKKSLDNPQMLKKFARVDCKYKTILMF